MAPGINDGEGRPQRASADMSEKLAGLAELAPPALRQYWRRLYRSEPPARIKRELLLLAVAWKVQEQALGGYSVRTRRRLAQLGADRGKSSASGIRSHINLKPGLRLVREWHGTTHQVLVLEDGFEWNATIHKSLSAIARQITGTPWSGPRFFGLYRKSLRSAAGSKLDD